jgi:hypothetical protein
MSQFETFKKFFENKELINLIKRLESEISRKKDAHFNIFTLVSNQYLLENLHSDILSEFLNPKGNHKQKNKFLNVFLEMINNIGSDKSIKIDIEAFKNAEVEREENRIDVLIKGNGQAIIFENKINGAGDMYKQLPKYFNEIKDDYKKIAIVYMPKRANQTPNETDWNVYDKENVNQRLIIFNSFGNISKENNLQCLIEKWQEVANEDNKCILKQYSKLLEMMNENIATDVLSLSIYKYFLENEQLKSLYYTNKLIPVLIKKIGEEIKTVLNNSLKDEFKKLELNFRGINVGEEQITLQNFNINGIDLIIYVKISLCELGLTSKITLSKYSDTKNGTEKFFKTLEQIDQKKKLFVLDESKNDSSCEYVKEFYCNNIIELQNYVSAYLIEMIKSFAEFDKNKV